MGATNPRRVVTTPTKPVVVYSDACGAGHLGAMVYVVTKCHTVSTHAPEWFTRSSAGIFELEALAELLGVMLACEVAPGAPIVLCCDNRAAVATVIRGTCQTVLGRMIASAIWATASRFNCPIWVEPVRSCLNPSDPPSRACAMLPDEERHALPGTVENIPKAFADALASRNSLAIAQLGSLPHVTGRVPPWTCPKRSLCTSESIP